MGRRLALDRTLSLGVYLGAGDVPTRREARLGEHQWRVGVCDDPIVASNNKVTGGAADVDAVGGRSPRCSRTARGTPIVQQSDSW